MLYRTLSLLGVWPNSIPINKEKLQTELNGSHYTKLDNFKIYILILNFNNL
jgi:hypothetical protein